MSYLFPGLRRSFIARPSPPLVRESFFVFINLDDKIYFMCGVGIASLRYAVPVFPGSSGHFERNTHFESLGPRKLPRLAFVYVTYECLPTDYSDRVSVCAAIPITVSALLS